MHIKESLLRLLKSKDYKPVKREEIGNVLRLKGEELEALYQCIQALEDERKLEFLRERAYSVVGK